MAIEPANLQDSQRFWLTFAWEDSELPLISEVSQKFHLRFSIRNSGADAAAPIAFVALELSGAPADIRSAVRWIRKKGVRVEPIELSAIEG